MGNKEGREEREKRERRKEEREAKDGAPSNKRRARTKASRRKHMES